MTCSARCLAICAAILSLVPRETAAQTDRPQADKTLSPFFYVENGDPSVDRLPLKDTRVDVSITGVIADVAVRQIYENRGQRPIHARYIFPASTRAAVNGMTMTIGDVRIVATIKEREHAKAEFERAKREGKSASLLEESRPNVFTMSVANVMPGDSIAVELKYTELLVPTDGVYEFVYPTVVGPRFSEKKESQTSTWDTFVKAAFTREGEPPRSEFHLAGRVAAGMPIQELASPSHQLIAREAGSGRAEVELAESERFSGNRDFILSYRLAGPTIGTGLLLYRGGGENFFLLMAQPPAAVKPEELPAREYIFVVDVSGSMNGFPINTAKQLMSDLVGVMRPSDAFNVMVFADGSETFAPASVPATKANLTAALRFIGRKDGSGGTRLLAALQGAVALPRHPGVSRSVVLITDGYIEAERDVFDYVRGELDATNFFAFGIGTAVNRYLIEGVAHAGLGEPFIVTGPGEAPEAAARFRRYIDSPVLTGIDVKFNGFDAYDVEPKQIPDLFSSRPVVVFGKWRGDVNGVIEIDGTTGRQPYHAVIPVMLSDADTEHAALRQLWARTRISNLSDYGAANDPSTIAEVTSLGLTYSLLTRYTSFVAVQEIVRHTGDADDVDQPLPLPQGVSNNAVGVTRGAEPELIWLLAIALALMAGARAMRARPARESAAS